VSFLETYPLDWTDPRLRELHGALAGSFYRAADIEQIVLGAGVPPAELAWDRPARTLWHDTIRVASDHELLRPLLDMATERTPAFGRRVNELLAPSPAISAEAPSSQPERLAPDDPRWKNFSAGGLERQIVEGDETLLDVCFLERGLERAAAVCRLTVSMDGVVFVATGFRIGLAHVLTNHHVLFDWDNNEAPALSVRAEFGYEIDLQGVLRTPVSVAGDVTTIKGERAHDFAVIAMGEAMPDYVPMLPLGSHRPLKVEDRVVIVQHPNGLPKKIALAHNLVRFVDGDLLQYWTDTEPGSSGSPVFNEAWEVVGLHHQWVDSPVDDGQAFRNQGRAITRVAERIDALGVALGEG
jgi:V8-like Glu-specific endopeptidase